MSRPPALVAGLAALAVAACAAGCRSRPAPGERHVILIDIDDHGLAGLWAAQAPNLKSLIAGGTFGYTRVIVPTHSNQSNIALLTAAYPDGNGVPTNSWLSRAQGFAPPLQIGSLGLGQYALWDENPLRVRNDSLYQLTRRAGGRSAYVGQLPPFEAGADDVHLAVVGLSFGGLTVSASLAPTVLTGFLHYPQEVADGYHYDGPPADGETLTRFTMRDAAAAIAATSAQDPMPRFMFVWDFIALDDDPTGQFGADSPEISKVIDDYDAGLGQILTALRDKGLADSTDILFTLDHGKVDTHNQVVLGARGGGGSKPADGQLAALVAGKGAALGLTADDYALMNEDGDALLYARVDGAGTAAGAARQDEVRRKLLALVQSGDIVGLDTTRTLTADGAMGTRRFADFRAGGPDQPDIMLFPQPDWTLNQVDAANAAPGPFQEHGGHAYGRHGGFSPDELYVPFIMSGPDFKRGVLLPHPVEHPDLPATAAWLVAGHNLDGAEGAPVLSALLGNSGETVPQPADMTTSRDIVLRGGGFAGAPVLAGPPATAALLIDLGGVYFEELFADGASDAGASLRTLAARGATFQNAWARYRDWPVNEYEMLAGGYPPPLSPTACLPHAESDPSATVAPACGFLQRPAPPGFIADRAGYDLWRQAAPWGADTLFDAARALGLATGLVGEIDFHDKHVDTSRLDLLSKTDGDGAAAAAAAFFAAHPRALLVAAMGGGARTADRGSQAARDELAALSRRVDALVRAAPGALIVIAGRGATPIDDAGADGYGPGTSRHVPLVVVGPNVRAGTITSLPAQLADVPATILMGLGAPLRTDFVDGTWAAGATVGGIPQPSPAGATAGRALVRAFTLASP